MMQEIELTADEMADLVEQFWSLGGESVELGFGRLVRSPAAPGHVLGNFLTSLRAGSGDQLVSLLSDVEAITGAPCRRGLHPAEDSTGRRSAARAERLVARDATSARAPGGGLHRASHLDVGLGQYDEDWLAIKGLFRTDHIEEDRRAGRTERSVSETRAAVLLRRGLVPATYFVARRDSGAVGCIGVWTRSDGAAMI